MSLQGENLKAIADAIRNKKGTSEPIKASDFASEILSIESGSSGANGEYNIKVLKLENGTYKLAITDYDYISQSYDRVFGNNTPLQISTVSEEISKNGYNSTQVAEIYGWNLGDIISIPLTTGENIELQIIGINHDTKSDGSGKAGITLQMVNRLATTYPMNSTSTNAGGYSASVIKTETLPTFKALLPQEWQNIIKLVDKKSANGGGTNYTETLTSSEDLFLLSEIEMFGTIAYAQNGTDEGNIYEYWDEKTNSDKIKQYDTNADSIVDTAVIWWLRSCSSTQNNRFCTVNRSGNANVTASTLSEGISFAFCI